VRDIDVAIVIVTYRSAALPIDCLRSIERECLTSGMRNRAIVIPNASGDAPVVAEAIEANHWSSWVVILTAPHNGGFTYGNNLAIEHAYEDGPPDFVHLLNPDSSPSSITAAARVILRITKVSPRVGPS
jgi:N-acetylglucosaminyl-diphospho-decaprenol L-rhamnosyltransferase